MKRFFDFLIGYLPGAVVGLLILWKLGLLG